MRNSIADSLALISADILKLRRRQGLAIMTAVLTVGLVTVSYAILEALHANNPAKNSLPGGAAKLGNAIFILSMFGAIASAIVGATIGSGDQDAGVYRDLVITGRSRVALYISRVPAGLVYLLPFTLSAYAILTASRAYAIAIAIAWRLAATPLLAAATTLGALRDAIPGVAMENLAPTQIRSSVEQGPTINVSIIAGVTIVIIWAAVLLTASAWRETTRDA